MSATDIATSVDVDLDLIYEQTKAIAEELINTAAMKPGQILVVGCSSSEIAAHAIGCYSSSEVGQAVFTALSHVTKKHGLYLAAQCCEHLNRALIVEEECAEKYGLEMVNVKPQLKAGGSFSTAAWNGFESPCAVEYIQAHAGIDIGDTLIGMPSPCCRSGPHEDPVHRLRPCRMRENETQIYRRRAGCLPEIEVIKMM